MSSFFSDYLTGIVLIIVFAASVGVVYLLDRAVTSKIIDWPTLNFGRRLLLVIGLVAIVVPMAFISLFLVTSVYGLGNTFNVLLRGG